MYLKLVKWATSFQAAVRDCHFTMLPHVCLDFLKICSASRKQSPLVFRLDYILSFFGDNPQGVPWICHLHHKNIKSVQSSTISLSWTCTQVHAIICLLIPCRESHRFKEMYGPVLSSAKLISKALSKADGNALLRFIQFQCMKIAATTEGILIPHRPPEIYGSHKATLCNEASVCLT